MMPSMKGALVILVLASLAVPLANAQAGQLTASAARYGTGANQTGDLVAFFFADGNALDANGGGTQASFQLAAEDIEALSIERRYYTSFVDLGPAGSFAPPAVDDPAFDEQAPPQRKMLQNGELQMRDQQAGLQMHVLPASRDATVAYAAWASSGTFEAYEAIAMTAGRFSKPQALDNDIREDNAPAFWPVRVDAPQVVHAEQSGQFQLEVTGNFVLEIKGATLTGRDARGDVHLESGTWVTPLHPTQPAGGVSQQREILLRMFVFNGTLTLNTQGGAPNAFWASPSMAVTSEGSLAIEGAVGPLGAGRDVRALQGETVVLPAGTALELQAKGDNLAVAMAPGAASRGAAPNLAAQLPATYAAAIAIVALMAAVTLGALRRWGTPPTLQRMEDAIASGRFRRAAHVAKRILINQPSSEDAMLGRAIALSRRGSPGRAIGELHTHLVERGASDGSLHYVLGTSYLDLGRVDEARTALAEAARRTPALRGEVAHLLGEAPARKGTEGNAYV